MKCPICNKDLIKEDDTFRCITEIHWNNGKYSHFYLFTNDDYHYIIGKYFIWDYSVREQFGICMENKSTDINKNFYIDKFELKDFDNLEKKLDMILVFK